MRLDLTHVDRVEVIDSHGRALVRMGLEGVEASLQDGGKTLKLFISGDEENVYTTKLTAHGLVRPRDRSSEAT